MKKILLSILMLLLTVTAAWAGDGDGSKDHPFSGVWQASELASRIDKGKNLYLAYDCDIQSGSITVIDSKLNNTQIAKQWPAWSPGNVLGSSNYSGYSEYYRNNSLGARKSQLFIITDASGSGSKIYMTGYFSGSYDLAGIVLPKKEVDNVEYYVINTDEDYETFRNIVATGNPYANAILENDITVTKPIGSGAPQFHYRGTFDGQGHTIDVDSLANDNENHPWGLFQFTEPGCVIRNIKVTGKLTSDHEYLGSIVGEARGTRIENCISDAKLKNTSSTLPVTGGLIGAGHGVNFIENCAFIGEIDAEKEACGIIGKVVNNVEIKSCYVDARFSNPEKSNQIMFKDDDTQILMNCYYCDNDGTNYLSGLGLISASKDDLSKGTCSRLLNLKGRKGVVWYQHGDHPYPFKGEDGQLVVGGHVGIECAPEHYFESNGICLGCGALDPNKNVAPLQLIRPFIGEANDDDEIKINNLRFKTNEKRGLTTAELRGYYNNDALTAVHIPETINVNGEVYTIDYIAPNAFKGSKMEYCYIPKTITHIEDDAFNDCDQLKYLHIADCPSAGTSSLYLGHKNEDNELFEDCSKLEKVYIGRDLRWYPYSKWNPYKPDEPFEDRNSITDVFFGPRVTRIGNYYKEDAREGMSYDLFNECTGIKRVYIMGDDQSLGEEDLQDFCRDGLAKATTYYINRSVAYTKYWNYSVGRNDDMGALDRCENVSYGPFVKYIAKESFCGTAANNNNTMKRADFTNAFRLEKICENAFNECTELTGTLDFSKTQLKEIEHDAFYNVDKVTAVNFGSHLEKVGAKAFNDSEKITNITLPGTVTEVGDQAFGDMKGLATIRLEDGDGSIKFLGSGTAFEDTSIPLIDFKVSYIYQGRDYEYEGKPPFADCNNVSSVTIGPKVTKLNYHGYKNMKNLSITFLYSPDALTFEDTPAEVFHESKVRGMFIDRELRDKNGEHIDWSEGEDDEEYSTKKNVENLSFGDHITAIPEHLFDHFSALKSVIIPASVTEIGKQAFIECGKLENLYILGSTHIGREAFARCTNLKHLFLMGQTAKVDELVFTGCNNIKEVVTGFLEASDNLSGSEEAFTQDAYDKAHLVCAGDTKYHKIDFGTINPWCLFKSENRNSILTATDYDIEDGDNVVDDYDHGYMPHSFTKDKFELVYAPFQMDSYYFGSKADIYKMSIEDICTENASFEDEYTPTDNDFTYKTDNLKFTKVDIDNEKLLSRGVYLINTKTDKPLSNLASYHNLFKQETISVDNRSFFIKEGSSSYSTASMSYNSDYPAPATIQEIDDDVRCSFVCDGGVLKYVNGEYQPKVGEIVFKDYYEANKRTVFNMMEGQNPLLSSKIDMPFKAILDGYASFYASETAGYNYIAPSWCDVYIVTSANGETVTLQEIADRTINAGQAVLLKSNKEENLTNDITEHLTFATNPSSASYDGNLLKGVEVETPVKDLGRDFVYVLSKTSGNSTGFYKYRNNLQAGKAYLDPDGLSTENLAKSCLFTFNDAANGIISHREETGNGYIYDLLGRRLKEAGYKGVYIVNGKKVVVK